MIRLFEMFAGCGGASFALQKAGINFKCIGFSEIDKAAIICYSNNFPNIKNYGDCTKIDPRELPSFDLLTGGFPCQAFSEAGKHRGELDTRGTLFYDIVRIAEAKKPKYLLLENVKGLTSRPHKMTFEKILSELDRIGYRVYCKVLNSRNYGIPQSRERVIFVCFRKDVDSGFEFPKEERLGIFLKDIIEPPTGATIVSVAIRNKNRAKHQARGWPYGTFPKKYHLKYNDDLGVSYAVKSATHEFMIGNLNDVQAINSRFEDVKGLTPQESFKLFLKSEKIRELTPKECFRLMGFLNDEINLNGLSVTQQYNIAGNGWDINLISKILAEMFKSKEKKRRLQQKMIASN